MNHHQQHQHHDAYYQSFYSVHPSSCAHEQLSTGGAYQHTLHYGEHHIQNNTSQSSHTGTSPTSTSVVQPMRPITKSAARNRRERENYELEQLASLLPLPSAITSQLDKASVIRLTASYLNLTTLFPHGISQRFPTHSHYYESRLPKLREMASHLMQTLDGFVFILSPYGRIMYISETASVHVGMSQVELTGNSLFDYIHPDDHTELINVLQPRRNDTNSVVQTFGSDELELERHFFVRIKCVLAKRNAGLVDHGYKVMHCSGYLKLHRVQTRSTDEPKITTADTRITTTDTKQQLQNNGLLAIGYTLPATAVTEMRLSPHMFMFRADLGLKMIFIDTGTSELFDYDLCDLVDRSLYSVTHVQDTEIVKHAHQTVLARHQSTSKLYRFIMKNGVDCHWVQTHLALVQLNRTSRPTCIIGITHIVSSDIESRNVIGLETHNSQSTTTTTTTTPHTTTTLTTLI